MPNGRDSCPGFFHFRTALGREVQWLSNRFPLCKIPIPRLPGTRRLLWSGVILKERNDKGVKKILAIVYSYRRNGTIASLPERMLRQARAWRHPE
jgi:hypothetical protein